LTLKIQKNNRPTLPKVPKKTGIRNRIVKAMKQELKDYTDTELVEEIKVRIANNSIEIQALANLFITT
jgi:hypothetical protein